jgi:MFS family permease
MQGVESSSRGAVRVLAASRFASLTGTEAAFVALLYVVYARTGSPAWVSAALLLTFGAEALAGPIGGFLGDRFDRRAVMVASELAGAASFAVLALLHDPAAMIAVAFVGALTTAPFLAASTAAVPGLVREADLTWANSTVSIGRNAGLLVGPPLGGALVAATGAPLVFLLNAGSFLASAALLMRLPRGLRAQESDDPAHRGLRAGYAFLRRDRTLFLLTAGWVVILAGLGSVFVAEIPLARAFNAGSLGYGLISAGWGGGAILGAFLGRALAARDESRTLVGGTLVMALGFAVVAVTPWFALVLLAMLGAGAGDGANLVAEQNVLQRRSPDAVRARVAAAFEATVMGALTLSFAAAGPVVAALGVRGSYALAAASCLAGSAVLAAAVRAQGEPARAAAG